MQATYAFSITRCSAHRVRTALSAMALDPLEVEADRAATELNAAEIAVRWSIARHRAAVQRIERVECFERTRPEYSRVIA